MGGCARAAVGSTLSSPSRGPNAANTAAPPATEAASTRARRALPAALRGTGSNEKSCIDGAADPEIRSKTVVRAAPSAHNDNVIARPPPQTGDPSHAKYRSSRFAPEYLQGARKAPRQAAARLLAYRGINRYAAIPVQCARHDARRARPARQRCNAEFAGRRV